MDSESTKNNSSTTIKSSSHKSSNGDVLSSDFDVEQFKTPSYIDAPVEVQGKEDVHPRVAMNYLNICDASINDAMAIDRLSSDEESAKKYMDILKSRTVKDSKFFGELWQEKMRGNTNYVTIYDNLLEGEQPYIPLWVNCIRKNISNSRLFTECMCPKLLNLFNQKTVYNAIIDENTLVSVECVKDGQSLYSLHDFYPEIRDGERGVLTDIKSLKTITNLFKNSSEFVDRLQMVLGKDFEISNEDLKKLESDVVMQYLMRVCLLKDSDYELRNVGIMVSEGGKIEIAPNFDFGYCFDEVMIRKHHVEKTLKYAKQYYPEIVDKFTSLVKENYENGKLEKVIDEVVPVFQEIHLKNSLMRGYNGAIIKGRIMNSVQDILDINSALEASESNEIKS